MPTAAAAETPNAAAPADAGDGAAGTEQAASGGGGGSAAPAPALLHARNASIEAEAADAAASAAAAAPFTAAANAVESARAIARLKARSDELGACFDALQATMPAYQNALDEFNSMPVTKAYEEARRQLEAASELVVVAKSECDGHFF
jgi:hypothetical protein